VFFFDLDGTVYLDGILFEKILELIEILKNKRKKIYFLTNNSSISTKDYYIKLKRVGLPIKKDNIIVSTHPTIQFLKTNNFKKIFLLGTKSLQNEFIDAGFKLTDDDPEIVVLAFDKELTYVKLEKAAYFLQDGLPYIATHPDKVCPTKNGYIPDVGAMIALFFESTGKIPKIFGKPNKEMLLFKLRELNLTPDDAVLIGDRLYTDIRMANEANITSICVLTGETTEEMIKKSEFKPDIVLNKAADLIKYI
jgi:HAD superfamily hydrolase (TIGR01450 family)